MALSMDEQRILAEIERRLSAEDPGLAARLSSFRRPGPPVRLRSTRGRVIGSLFTVAVVAVISMMVYVMVPFRAHALKQSTTPQASGTPGISAPAKTGPPAGLTSARATAPAGTSGTGQASRRAATTRAATPKAATPKPGSRPAASSTSPTAPSRAPVPVHT